MKKPLRRFVSLALSALMAALAFGGALPAAAQGNVRENIQQQFYVSPEGDDQNDGSEGSPFATIERARQAVDEVNDHMTGDIIVNIAPGD